MIWMMVTHLHLLVVPIALKMVTGYANRTNSTIRQLDQAKWLELRTNQVRVEYVQKASYQVKCDVILPKNREERFLILRSVH